MTVFLFCLGAFLLGSVPTGYLVAKAKGVDIRQVGSGNIGATNVARALGKGPAIVVFVLDVLKGLAPPLLLPLVVPSLGMDPTLAALSAGVSAIAGHVFSPFLGFKGGKGIATGLGALLGAVPLVGCLALSGFLVTVVICRLVSLGSIVSVIVMGASAFVIYPKTPAIGIVLSVLAVVIIVRHKANVSRIIAGTEPRLSFAKRKTEGEDQTCN